MTDSVRKSKRVKVLKHLGNVCMSVVWLALMTSPVVAIIDPSEAASQVIGSEGGAVATKAVIQSTLAAARSKPAMSAATAIVCLACLPAAGVLASPGLCVACGVLIAKTLG